MRAAVASLALTLTAGQVEAFQTLDCVFERVCTEEGDCRAAAERLSIDTVPVIGARDRAQIGFADSRGKVQVAYDRRLGILNWRDSRYGNAMMFTPASPRTLWSRIPITFGTAEVLFGSCREAF